MNPVARAKLFGMAALVGVASAYLLSGNAASEALHPPAIRI